MSGLLIQLQGLQRPYLTTPELDLLIDGSTDSRYGKIKRLLEKGRLLHIRRGLYCTTDITNSNKPHPFELAQYIYGPSYISFESALAYHQLIPEAVYATTSACCKRSKEFHTPLGVFSYLHLPTIDFYTQVELVNENNYHFFMATPWKAICDYIFCYKKNWGNLDPLISSLRIDPEELPKLTDKKIELLDDYYKNKKISLFLRNVHREFSS